MRLSEADALEHRPNHVWGEGLGPGHEVRSTEPVGLEIGELLGEVANAIGAGQRGQLDRAEHADRSAGGAQEATTGVAGDSRCQRVDVMAPPARGVLHYGPL